MTPLDILPVARANQPIRPGSSGEIAKFEPTQIVISTDSPEEIITLEELHRRHVRRVLAAVKGNKTHAAKLLGIDRRSLYRRLEDRDTGAAKPLQETR